MSSLSPLQPVFWLDHGRTQGADFIVWSSDILESKRAQTRHGRNAMASTAIVTPAAEITARLDRLPMTRHMWMLVLLISLGGWFDTYAIFLTGSIAPGMFADKIFTPTTVSLFGFTGLASFIAALFAGLFIGTMFFTQAADRFGRRTVFTYSLVWYCIATLVMAFQTTPNGINLWRFIAGIGIGVELVTVDTFISELVPKRARGKTFAMQQSIGFIPVPLALGGNYRFGWCDHRLVCPPQAPGIATLARPAGAARSSRPCHERDRSQSRR
jgi:sugar transport protein